MPLMLIDLSLMQLIPPRFYRDGTFLLLGREGFTTEIASKLWRFLLPGRTPILRSLRLAVISLRRPASGGTPGSISRLFESSCQIKQKNGIYPILLFYIFGPGGIRTPEGIAKRFTVSPS